MSNQREIFQVIKSLTGQANILTIPRVFIDFTGTVEAAMVLSQIIYWSDRASHGWFYKSYPEWKEELALSEYHVHKAVKGLQGKGILRTRVMRANGSPTLHYLLDVEAFTKAITAFLDPPAKRKKRLQDIDWLTATIRRGRDDEKYDELEELALAKDVAKAKARGS